MARKLLDFTGRHVVLTGAASGMGAAACELFVRHGAQVFALDLEPVVDRSATVFACDLGSEASIDAAVAQLPAQVDVLVNCAGIPNGGRFDAEQIMSVNWLGLKHLTESLLTRMPAGSAVVHVASTAGRNWVQRRDALADLVAVETFADGLGWVRAHPNVVADGYAFSKEAVQFYTHARALETVAGGVRMNSICPGVTDTSLVEDFRRGVGDEVLDRAVEIAGRMANPAEMAPPMLFLADEASSSYVNGVNLNVDLGTGAAHATGRF